MLSTEGSWANHLKVFKICTASSRGRNSSEERNPSSTGPLAM
eukprot:CAMPEP_0203901498 /NCGR_PEP_ID=MMETSP0359-20131031/43661_1 /ASSEMBLY_ACC=CAM_ASM_000338 /TAXON_ID=268821 /ORGANISM="Scrippsiella Hangoei, Strain SHTV-5" /LENGTH=41 /DNA_ID= /DNA_START= /DNA_END= /DNA_ORIENTATION=